uniref:Complement receptor type 2-like n=1 Tax=Astyanax mexicanus TaxID=7994 RepID=A0A3B1IJY0_ASTMX
MLCNTFLLLLFLLKAVNIRGGTTAVPELLSTQNPPESTTTSAQCQRPTLPDKVILKADSYKEIYEKDSTAKLECEPGYTPATFVSRTIKCLGGIWTETKFRCKKKSCGALKDIPNGRYLITEGIEFGAVVKAECNLGYELYGSDTRVCKLNGWTGRDIECEVVKCTEVPTIANGKPEEEPYSQYEFGQSISYRCNKDFDMFGDSTITCSKDGKFQPAPPECLKISCARPEIPDATRTEGRSPYRYKSTVRYECNRGYKMNGEGYLVCQKDGWVPPPPNCTMVTCPKPSVFDNGYFSPDKELYKYEEKLTFSCKKGFRLEGASEIVCTMDEIFKPPPPRCVVVTCPTPQSISNGRINDPILNIYNYGQTVTYSCMEGFRLRGESRLSCIETGKFHPNPPTCVRTCPGPPVIANGEFDPVLVRYDSGQAVTYSCIKGFRLQGASKVSCSEEGTFKPNPPECVETCPTPPTISNGEFDPHLKQYDQGQKVTYSCPVGYRLNGFSTIICSKGGKYHPPPPTQCELHWGAIAIFTTTPLALLALGGALFLRNKKKSQSYSMSTFDMKPLSNK